jgi:hypothetical protein
VGSKRLLTSAIVVLAASAVSAPGASAQSPSGTCAPNQTVAALDQYCDFLPTSAGASTPLGSGPAEAKPLKDALTPEQAERLRKAGMPGKVLLVMPTLSPITPEQAKAAERRRAELRREGLVPTKRDAPEKDDLGQVAAGVASSAADIVGGAFRWGLVICSLGVAGMTWLRFRSRLKI